MKSRYQIFPILLSEIVITVAVYLAGENWWPVVALLLLVLWIVVRDTALAIALSFLVAWAIAAWGAGDTRTFLIASVPIAIHIVYVFLRIPSWGAAQKSGASSLRVDFVGAAAGIALGWLIFSFTCPTPWLTMSGSDPDFILSRMAGCFAPVQWNNATGELTLTTDTLDNLKWVLLLGTFRNPFMWGIALSALAHTGFPGPFGRWLLYFLKGFLLYNFVMPFVRGIVWLPLFIPFFLIGEDSLRTITEPTLLDLEQLLGRVLLANTTFILVLALLSLAEAFLIALSVWIFSSKNQNKQGYMPPNMPP